MAQPVDYFAYGTLLDQRTMRALAGEWDRLIPARLDGYRIRFGPWSDEWRGHTADLEPAPGESVHGVVYRILTPQLAEIIAAHPGYGAVPVSVVTDDDPLRAVALASRESSDVGPPSEAYLRAIEEGMRQHGFDPRIARTLRDRAAASGRQSG